MRTFQLLLHVFFLFKLTPDP